MKMTRAQEVLKLCKRLSEITELGNRELDLDLSPEEGDDFLYNILEATSCLVSVASNMQVNGIRRLKAKAEAVA